MRGGAFENALGAMMAAFVAMVLAVVPGFFFLFLLPLWLALPLMLAVSGTGGFLMLRLSDDVNGTSFTRLASVDTHAKRGDAAQTAAPFMSGAVPAEEQADAQPPPSNEPEHD